jgi:predicted esterase
MTYIRASVLVLISLVIGGLLPVAAQGPAAESFAAAYERLERGPAYSADVPTGRLEFTRSNEDGLEHRYVLIIPENYDPTRRYPAVFYLNGGVSRGDRGAGGSWWRNYDNVLGGDRIAVFPQGWSESMWWQASQVENLRGILSELKRTYNVDENRVYAVGQSDGGTGAYFYAFRDTTPWAAFLPLIGYPGVLMNPNIGVDGLMHLGNLTNKPFFIANGIEDPLYPVRIVEPVLATFREVGVEHVFTAKPGGHSTRWWPEEAANIERFIAAHPRSPHPERVFWATERADAYNRAHWLVIDELGPVAGDSGAAGLADLTAPGDDGVVRAVRAGNTVTLEAYGVRQLTLLVSPEVFDLGSPIRVIANGEVVFDAVVPEDVATLQKWAARDEDRTMLYAAELTIELR